MPDSGLIVFNGIDGSSGNYLVAPTSANEVVSRVLRHSLDNALIEELKRKHALATMSSWGVRRGVNPTDLEQAGWGVIFAFSDNEKLDQYREALEPLLRMRRRQAGDKLYKEFSGPSAYRDLEKESRRSFLARHDKGPGDADPGKVPYYLLIVGDPSKIPFKIQYQLDVDYAVGRLCFDNLDSYATYAASVAAYEESTSAINRSAAFFAVKNHADRATQMSLEYLVKPLIGYFRENAPGWSIKEVLGGDAHKAALSGLLSGGDRPDFLFTASHGMGFPRDHDLQLRHQGSILCQDWPGPLRWNKPIPSDFYYSADDLDDPDLSGLISFHFACYGAGTPLHDDYWSPESGESSMIASKPFVAGLPSKLLGSTGGGALACIGHVDRAWGYSFMWPGAGQQLQPFEDSISSILDGIPIGHAMETFGARYSSISAELSDILHEIKYGVEPDAQALAGMWTSNNDARSYVILGDPAVRLRLTTP
jgi:hypothetical protein